MPLSGTEWALYKCVVNILTNRWMSELGAGPIVRLWSTFSWLTSLGLWLGACRWVNLTISQRTGGVGEWDLVVFHSRRAHLNFYLLCWLWRPLSSDPTGVSPAFGVGFLPKGHKYGGAGLLASVLDGLQSHSCFFSENFLGPDHGTWRPLLKYTFGYFLCFTLLRVIGCRSWQSWVRTLFDHHRSYELGWIASVLWVSVPSPVKWGLVKIKWYVCEVLSTMPRCIGRGSPEK